MHTDGTPRLRNILVYWDDILSLQSKVNTRKKKDFGYQTNIMNIKLVGRRKGGVTLNLGRWRDAWRFTAQWFALHTKNGHYNNTFIGTSRC